MESTRADLRQSVTTKTDLTKELTELASTRVLENKICGMKKSVVDDYVDAVDAAVAVYQVSFTQRQRFPVLLKLHICICTVNFRVSKTFYSGILTLAP